MCAGAYVAVLSSLSHVIDALRMCLGWMVRPPLYVASGTAARPCILISFGSTSAGGRYNISKTECSPCKCHACRYFYAHDGIQVENVRLGEAYPIVGPNDILIFLKVTTVAM